MNKTFVSCEEGRVDGIVAFVDDNGAFRFSCRRTRGLLVRRSV